jgi:hypothetical protein
MYEYICIYTPIYVKFFFPPGICPEVVEKMTKMSITIFMGGNPRFFENGRKKSSSTHKKGLKMWSSTLPAILPLPEKSILLHFQKGDVPKQ